MNAIEARMAQLVAKYWAFDTSIQQDVDPQQHAVLVIEHRHTWRRRVRAIRDIETFAAWLNVQVDARSGRATHDAVSWAAETTARELDS